MSKAEMLEAIGLSAEELQERVIERAAQKLAKRVYGEGSSELRDAVERIIGETVNKVADEELRPWAEGQIEAVVMQLSRPGVPPRRAKPAGPSPARHRPHA